MKKEKIEESIRLLRIKIKDIDNKYAEKQAELDKAHTKDVSALKEKEKFLSDKLKSMEMEEKMKLVSKIPFDRLKEFAEEIEKNKKVLEERRNQITESNTVPADTSTPMPTNTANHYSQGGNFNE